MKQITLRLNEGKHQFKGELLASTRNEFPILRQSGLHRELIHHALYRQEDLSFLVYQDRQDVGTGNVERTAEEIESIAGLHDLIPTKAADQLIKQILDTHAPK